MGMTLERDGVELYVLDDKDDDYFFLCIAIQELSKHITSLLPNMFCVSIVGCKKERFNITKFGDIVSPYSIEMSKLITCGVSLPPCTDSSAK